MNDNKSWDTIGALFAAAVALPSERRMRFLDEACGRDAEVRAEVLSLLAAHDANPAFMDQAPLSAPIVTDAALGPDAQVVESYQLFHRIGHGGMAEVFYAQRANSNASQGVALKLLHAGLSHPELIQRFRREQRILAGFDHPHISRLLDCGTARDGRLFLVTDFVEGGEPIDQFCDQRSLGIRERLELFLQLCEALQYVHQRLVVHGDLKPGNVLVSAEGRIKLLDFGIARLLGSGEEDVTRLTGALPRPMTSAYASPEQMSGEPPTTSSDIYSLGVLLYELLCGERPYIAQTRNPAELLQLVSHTIPESPSSRSVLPEQAAKRGMSPERLARTLRGDLDTIALRAMAKAPNARFATAMALAEDVQRYLQGFPVHARPVGRMERAFKLVRRNPVTSATSIAALLALVVFSVGALYHSIQITRQAEVLRQALARAQATTAFLTGLFESTDPTRRLTMQSSAGDLLALGKDRLLADSEVATADRAAILTVIASAYEGLGSWDMTRQILEQVIPIYRKELPPSLESVRALTEYANIHFRESDYVQSERLAAEALTQALIVIPDRIGTLSSIRNTLGLSLWSQGRHAEAENVLAEAVRGRRALAKEDKTAELATALNSLGSVYVSQNRLDEANSVFEEAEQIFIRDLGSDHPRLAYHLYDLVLLNNLREQYSSSIEMLNRAIGIVSKSQGPDHPFIGAAQSTAAVVLLRTERYEEARATQLAGLRILKATVTPNHPYIGTALITLGRIHLKLNQAKDAANYLEEGVVIMRQHQQHLGEIPGMMAAWIEALIALKQIDRARNVLADAKAHAALHLKEGHADRTQLDSLEREIALKI